MKKLWSVVQYECATSFRYLWIFYLIQYAIVLLITLIIGISLGSFQNVGTNCLELNTLIYVGVLGTLGFQEDFKMLIQNGFTRRYIFLATFSMFAFISGVMALVDTAVGNLLHSLVPGYDSFFGAVYRRYGDLFANWIWLFLIYLLVCSLLYFAVLAVHKLGKHRAIFAAVLFGGACLAATASFRYLLPPETIGEIGQLAARAFGFMEDGSINYLFPVLTLLLPAAVLALGAYGIIRRTELRAG